MSLAEWEKNGWLRPHQTSAQEIGRLLAVVERDLADSRVDEASRDGRFSVAYNALVQVAIAALAASGYRPEKGGQHHFRAIQSLSETLAVDLKVIAVLDAYRKKRNVIEYERAGVASDADVVAMRGYAESTRDRLLVWLGEKHPKLAPKP